MRRGMTLLETLVSVTLLASVVVAVGGWLELAARGVPRQAADVRWRDAVERALALIHDDLETGDFLTEPRTTGVEVGNGRVEIDTRETGVGPATNRYEVEHGSGHLVRTSLGDGRAQRRVLVGDTNSLTVQFDEEHSRLELTVRSTAGDVVERAYLLPKERRP